MKPLSIAIILAALLATVSLSFAFRAEPQPETSITCTTNDSKIYADQGWKKIETVDYHRKSLLAGNGEIQLECKPGSLMCTAFIDGKAYPETKGCAWYWRKT